MGYKENIRNEVNIDPIYEINVKTYDRKDGGRYDEVGIIAEELAEIAPDLVSYRVKNKEEIKKAKKEKRDAPQEILEPESYSKSDLVPLIIKALQEQKKEIEELKARIEILEQK